MFDVYLVVSQNLDFIHVLLSWLGGFYILVIEFESGSLVQRLFFMQDMCCPKYCIPSHQYGHHDDRREDLDKSSRPATPLEQPLLPEHCLHALIAPLSMSGIPYMLMGMPSQRAKNPKEGLSHLQLPPASWDIPTASMRSHYQ